jgi:hypothetical protein
MFKAVLNTKIIKTNSDYLQVNLFLDFENLNLKINGYSEVTFSNLNDLNKLLKFVNKHNIKILNIEWVEV